MEKTISISLGLQETFINDLVASGRYQNACEAILAGLTLLRKKESCFTLLRHAIQKGVDSGFVVNFDPQKHLDKLKRTRTTNF
ncbi:MAG: type II toxin-antitoxin system ParD family antitoxin [Bacteroidota bacterium]